MGVHGTHDMRPHTVGNASHFAKLRMGPVLASFR